MQRVILLSFGLIFFTSFVAAYPSEVDVMTTEDSAGGEPELVTVNGIALVDQMVDEVDVVDSNTPKVRRKRFLGPFANLLTFQLFPVPILPSNFVGLQLTFVAPPKPKGYTGPSRAEPQGQKGYQRRPAPRRDSQEQREYVQDQQEYSHPERQYYSQVQPEYSETQRQYSQVQSEYSPVQRQYPQVQRQYAGGQGDYSQVQLFRGQAQRTDSQVQQNSGQETHAQQPQVERRNSVVGGREHSRHSEHQVQRDYVRVQLEDAIVQRK